MAKALLISLFAVTAIASPVEERNLNCNAVNDIITIMRAQRVATPFCSSVLSIPTLTQTSTVTSTPKCVTQTTSVQSTETVTSISTSVVYATTTIYPVVAISTTSTCALGATVVPTTDASGATTTPAAYTGKAKRGGGRWPETSTAIGIPTCLTRYQGSALTSACSCLNIPTPTSLSITTKTLPVSTVTKVIASLASATVISVVTSTSFTSTYSATQYYTSTFTVLPQPTETISLADGEVYGVYPGLDFAGQDIQNFFCYANGPAPPAPYPGCASFNECVAACAFYNDNKLGGSTGTQCGAVVYNAPPDGSSGSCYLKTGQTGCGSTNSMTNTGVLLPLIPNDVQ